MRRTTVPAPAGSGGVAAGGSAGGAGAAAGAGAAGTGAAGTATAAPFAEEAAAGLFGPGRTVGAPIVYRNLALFPVLAPDPGADEYLVLDEALPAGLVRVHESGEGVVSELTIENRSDRPLFLMAGEILVGGKQDRVISKNTIVAARTTTNVPVRCVERGRWAGRVADFESAGALAHLELRKKAVFADQPDVWAEVATKAELRKAETATSTYGAVAAAGKTDASIEAYAAHFETAWKALGARDRAIGFVVALNAEVVAVELFAAAPLFRKLRPKLMHSYYVEAVDRPVVVEHAPPASAVDAFAARARAASKGAKVSTSGSASETHDFADDDVGGSTVRAAKKPSPKGPPGKKKPPSADDAPVFESFHAL